jgi:hypothetical protein
VIVDGGSLSPIQGQIKMVMPDQDQTPEQVRKALGQRIKNLRIKKSWSQKLLAETFWHQPAIYRPN